MKKIIMVVSASVLCCACAETPSWTPGLVVNEMIQLQVANKEVIDNPAEGVASAYEGASGEAVINAHRAGSAGGEQSVSQPIVTSATGSQ